MKRRWLVRSEQGDERVEADEVEITPSGALVFYRHPSHSDRTLLLSVSPHAWRRCELEAPSS